VIQDKHASCGAEDTPIEDGVAVVANALDISEECVAFQAKGQTPRMVCFAYLPNCQIMTTCDQGTPPYMAIEALLGFNPNFIHKPQHDLESMLYVIFYVCTFVRGPGLLLNESDTSTALSLPIHTWFSNDEIRDIGYRKLAHLGCYDHSILPNFTPYWHDFTPFVKDLIVSCFPVTPRFPNEMQYERVLQILEKAYNTVEEPLGLTNQVSQALVRPTKRANSSSSSRDPKKARQA
jgi:serine/threonine protein kinase